MNNRERLIEAIEQTPDDLLPELIDFVEFVRTRRGAVGDQRSRDEQIRALEAWAGHLEVPPLPAEAYDRENLY